MLNDMLNDMLITPCCHIRVPSDGFVLPLMTR